MGRWLVEKTNEDADLSRVLWTDESHFAQMGIGCTTYITGTMKTHISRERERERERENFRFVGPSTCG
jgi:hypothetical protein